MLAASSADALQERRREELGVDALVAATKVEERLSSQVEQHVLTQEIGASYSFPSGDTDSEPEVMVVVAKDVQLLHFPVSCASPPPDLVPHDCGAGYQRC